MEDARKTSGTRRNNGLSSRKSAVLRGALALGVVPLAGLLASCGGGGGGGDGGTDSGVPLVVVAATPTNGQETLSDLSDPELNNRITLTFSNTPRLRDLIDPANDFSNLTPNVQVLDQNFARVRGTPSLDPLTQRFTFAPDGGVLPAAQYTVTVSKNVRTASGEQLGYGLDDFSTAFTVGPDIYPPRIRNITPAPLQNDTPLFAPIVMTFNESLDPSTVVLGQTVFVQDGGTNPPTPINGTLSLRRNGFDLVFTPDPCAGLPPSTTIVVRLVGTGFDQNLCTPSTPPLAFLPNTSFIRDMVGNGLLGDLCNPAGEVTFQFNTKGVKPLPNPCFVGIPGLPFSAALGGSTVYASTFDKLLAIDHSAVNFRWLSTGTFFPDLSQLIKNGNISTVNACVPGVTPLPQWGSRNDFAGDFETRIERAGEGVVETRLNGANLFHTYIYMVDEANDSVAIINSGNGKIEGRFRGVGTPRGIGYSIAGTSPTLFITNYGQATVTGISLAKIIPGQPICTAVQELNDDVSARVVLPVGRNPVSVSLEWNGNRFGAVANQGDNTITIFDPLSLGTPGNLSSTYQVGEQPTDVVWTPFFPGVGIFAFVSNQGGDIDPSGSVSVWWSSAGGSIFTTGTGSVTATVQDNVNGPGRLFLNQFTPAECMVPNTAEDTVSTVQLLFQGGYIFQTVIPRVSQVRTVGLNPTKVTMDNGPIPQHMFFAALAGEGQVAIWDGLATISPPFLLPVPGVRSVFTVWDQ